MSDFLEINKHYLSIFSFKTAYNWLLISYIAMNCLIYRLIYIVER